MSHQMEVNPLCRILLGVALAYHFGATPKGVDTQKIDTLIRSLASAVSLSLALQQYSQYAPATVVHAGKWVHP